MPVALVVHAHTNGTLFVRVSGIDENRVATSAKKLETGRTIGMTGDVSWTSGSFDGTGNVTGTATLTNSGVAVGTYDNVTVDVKGRVTAGTNNISADISALVI
jgi:phage-related tail fiber protein